MISPEDLAALRDGVLRSHDEFLRMEPKPRSMRMHLRLKRLHLSWPTAERYRVAWRHWLDRREP